MHSSLKLLIALAPVPLLLAPVRLDDASPPLLQNMGNDPAPQSYSLPAATVLAAPTVIPVSPTGIDAPPPQTNPSPTQINPPPTANQPATTPNQMPLMAAQLCVHTLATTVQLSLLAYESKQNQYIAALTVTATAAANQAAALNWPNMQALEFAYKKLPWSMPYSTEINTTAKAALKLCKNPNTSNTSHGIGHSQTPIERPN